MKVQDIMTPAPETCGPAANLAAAVERLWRANCGVLPVVDERGMLTGVITDRDIVIRAVAEEKDPRGMPVREVASRELVTIRPDEDLSEALKLMASYQVRRLPVVDEDNTLVGVLAQADIAMEGKEKDFAHMVEDISRTPTGPRV